MCVPGKQNRALAGGVAHSECQAQYPAVLPMGHVTAAREVQRVVKSAKEDVAAPGAEVEVYPAVRFEACDAPIAPPASHIVRPLTIER